MFQIFYKVSQFLKLLGMVAFKGYFYFINSTTSASLPQSKIVLNLTRSEYLHVYIISNMYIFTIMFVSWLFAKEFSLGHNKECTV